MASFNQLANQGRTQLAAFDTKQLIVLMGGSRTYGGSGGFLWHLLATPDFKPLMTGMEPTDRASAGGRLAAKNISYQISRRENRERAQRQTGFQPAGSCQRGHAAQRPVWVLSCSTS